MRMPALLSPLLPPGDGADEAAPPAPAASLDDEKGGLCEGADCAVVVVAAVL
jgi:hypothetical protein